ncbi:N-acetylglucosamine-6-phosphate deacetylase [Devosia enhydra]|uniref:N-acetylglucosamine-6-phosphate deacetylase n=1 Tax=Devosia enhydra TaxID=665118 RepID=A0A1K2I1S5_9HYPH|nr:amidohydrolase family protein [Devosia enhydra]SFZ86334.1 N-acetylglucosamine-6-phosphate deacetylase [Devosia enhydra]
MTSGTLTGRDPATGAPLAVTYADGVITAITPGPADARGFLAPGLVDLQVNGFLGHDLNSGALTPETVVALSDAMLADGVTCYLPTLITASEASLIAGLRAIVAARRADPRLIRMIPGVHVEGPWLSPEDGARGAHPRQHVRAPDLAEFDRWQEAAEGLVRKVTLSPHWPLTPEVVEGLVARGVLVAIGHTHASPDEITAAFDAGATLSTHLGNGAAATLPRHPNLIWTQLSEDRAMAGLIADGHHLPAATFKAMLRAKGQDRVYLVSDVAAPGGLPPGTYAQPIGGTVELSADGRLSLKGTPYLAGAALPLKACVARAATMASIPLAEALMLATRNPGRLVGDYGRLEIGAPADLIRFDWSEGDGDLRLDTVLLGGVAA